MNAAPSPAELAELARQVLALSDTREAELSARLAAYRAGRESAAAEAARQWSAGYAAAVAEVKAAQHGIADAVRGLAETEAARWHLCCRPCRLGGHRPGCAACADRTRESFAEALPGEYAGGPVVWPSPAPEAQAAELVRGVA